MRHEVGAPVQPNIDFHAFDEQWNRLPLDEPDVEATIQGIHTDTHQYDIARKLIVDKPGPFRESEKRARQFMAGIGFMALPPIYLLRESKKLPKLDMDGETEVMAITEKFNRFILMREKSFRQCLQHNGEAKAGSLLVHEFAHGALKQHAVTLRMGKGEPSMTHRSGFIFQGETKRTGVFWDEAFACYLQGMYARAATGNMATGLFVSYSHEPSPRIPEHYRVAKKEGNGFTATTLGPDGYALEMIMGALHDRRIQSVGETFEGLRSLQFPDTQAQALRQFIGNVNRLEPDLYLRMRNLEYSRQNWRKACAYIYNLVTQETWQFSVGKR